ncbi:tetracycline resistance MFS efflux pump, partial [Acinetobacter baumannii]
FGWSVQAVGLSLAFVGVIVAIVQGVLQARIIGRFGERNTMLIGMAAGAASLAILGLTPVGWGILGGILLFGLWGMQMPALTALMSRRV